MNAVKQGIIACRQEIPEQILHDTFIAPFYQFSEKYNRTPINVDEKIMEHVIRNRVLSDLNLKHGKRVYIPLAGCIVQVVDAYSFVVTVPKEITEGKSLISALGITYYNPMVGNTGATGVGCTPGMVKTAVQNLANATDSDEVMSTDMVELVGENTVYVKMMTNMKTNGALVCTLEHDENLSMIKPRSIPKFKDLIVLACKAYIYNKMALTLDQGRLHAGHELGKYAEIVNSYSEANQEYKELLGTKIGKTLFMNDEEAYGRFIRSMMPGAGG